MKHFKYKALQFLAMGSIVNFEIFEGLLTYSIPIYTSIPIITYLFDNIVANATKPTNFRNPLHRL